jgi:hypothetical protein
MYEDMTECPVPGTKMNGIFDRSVNGIEGGHNRVELNSERIPRCLQRV